MEIALLKERIVPILKKSDIDILVELNQEKCFGGPGNDLLSICEKKKLISKIF